MRDLNINITCAHCGELLDTNEATRQDIDDGGQLDLSLMEFHVGTLHECFAKGGRNEVEDRCPHCGGFNGDHGCVTVGCKGFDED